MDFKKFKFYDWLLLAFGLFYTVVPHTIHHALKLDFGLPHGTHILIGLALLGTLLWRVVK